MINFKQIKRLTCLLILSVLYSCSNQDHPKTSKKNWKEEKKPSAEYLNFFSQLDTVNVGQTLGCSAGFYKLINEKYVLKIIPDFSVQFEKCYRIKLDSLSGTLLTELLVFDKKDATLSPFCTDIMIENGPKPTRTLHAESGEFTIGYSDAGEYYGLTTHHTTIHIKKMVFHDPETDEKIVLKNKLFWKVKDLGTPG